MSHDDQWWTSGARCLRAHASTIVPLVLVAAGWVGYNFLAEHWGLEWLASQVWTELPFVLLSYVALIQLLRPSRWRPLIAALPFVVMYVGGDYYQLVALRPLDWYDVLLVRQLLPVLSVTQVLLFVLVGVAPLVLFASQLHLGALRSRRLLVLVLPVLVLVAIEIFPAATMRVAINSLQLGGWSDIHEARCHGRLVMSLAREARRRQAAQLLVSFKPVEASPLWLSPEFERHLAHRNVILVLLEGFFDLRRLSAVHYSRSPLHEEFLRRVGSRLSTSISPAFGSGTARAEFELLCGVPALGLVGSEEFNAFTGSPSYCLPTILQGAGYATTVFDLGGPHYYNAVRAHQSLGFTHVLFPDTELAPDAEAIDTESKQTEWLFDGDLYKQVVSRLRTGVASGQPNFYFVVTMFGHIPFDLEPGTQPKVVGVSPNEPLVEILANQSYYRSKAMLDLVDGVAAIDPKALVIFVGDHAPPLPQGERDYARLGCCGTPVDSDDDTPLHEVPLVMYDRGRFVKLPLIHHFDVPAVILDRLSGGAYRGRGGHAVGNTDVDLDSYNDDYLTIIGLGAR